MPLLSTTETLNGAATGPPHSDGSQSFVNGNPPRVMPPVPMLIGLFPLDAPPLRSYEPIGLLILRLHYREAITRIPWCITPRCEYPSEDCADDYKSSAGNCSAWTRMHVFLHLLQEIDIVLSQHTAAQVQLLPPHGCAAREPHRRQQYSLVLGDRLEFQDIFDYS